MPAPFRNRHLKRQKVQHIRNGRHDQPAVSLCKRVLQIRSKGLLLPQALLHFQPTEDDVSKIYEVAEKKGGTTPSAFPHICVFSVTGVDKQTCISFSSVHSRNQSGCVAARCNSAARLCIKCVAQGLGIKAHAATNPATGLCDQHKQDANAAVGPLLGRQVAHSAAAKKKPEPRATDFSLPSKSGPSAQASHVAPSSEASPVQVEAGLLGKSAYEKRSPNNVEREIALMESLDDLEHLVLRMSSYGHSDNRVEEELRKLPGWQENDSFASIRNRMYAKLGVLEIEKERDRFTAAGKIFYRVVDSIAARERQLIDSDYSAMQLPISPTGTSSRVRPALPAAPSLEERLSDREELDRIWGDLEASGALESDEDVNELMRD